MHRTIPINLNPSTHVTKLFSIIFSDLLKKMCVSYCQSACENVKSLLCPAPVLAAPRLNEPFQVGTGAVLWQEANTRTIQTSEGEEKGSFTQRWQPKCLLPGQTTTFSNFCRTMPKSSEKFMDGKKLCRKNIIADALSRAPLDE